MLPVTLQVTLLMSLPLLCYSGVAVLVGWRAHSRSLYRSGLVTNAVIVGCLTIGGASVLVSALPCPPLFAYLWGVSGCLAVALARFDRTLPTHVPYMNVVGAGLQCVGAVCLLLVDRPLAVLAAPGAPEALIRSGSVHGSGVEWLFVAAAVFVTIPFVSLVGGLLATELNERWLAAVRGWQLSAWCVLSVAVVAHGTWLHLLPWCTATALLHTRIVQERRGQCAWWNVTCTLLTFLLAYYVIVASLHARVAVGLTAGCLVFFLACLWMRRSVLYDRGEWPDAFSREGILFLLAITCLMAMIPLSVGTMGLACSACFLVLAGLAPAVAWQSTVRAYLRWHLRLPLLAAVTAGLTAWVSGLRDLFPLLWVVGAAFVTVSVCIDVVRGYRAVSVAGQQGFSFARLERLLVRTHLVYALYSVHLGVMAYALGLRWGALLCVGISGLCFCYPDRAPMSRHAVSVRQQRRWRGPFPPVDLRTVLHEQMIAIGRFTRDLAFDRALRKMPIAAFRAARRTALAEHARLSGLLHRVRRHPVADAAHLPPPIRRKRGCPNCDAPCAVGSRFCVACGVPILQRRAPRAIDPAVLQAIERKVIRLG